MSRPSYVLINSVEAWQRCWLQLQGQPRLAIDLESNSMFAYRDSICLIQLSIPGHDFVLDPLATPNLAKLGQLLSDPGIEKIFHAAEYDILLMKREQGWQIRNLFDTMWASRILGYKRVGLASVLQNKFGVKLDKRYQRSNWCHRPLSPEQLAYARNDTYYLLQLRQILAGELQTSGRMDEAQEIFEEQCHVVPGDNSFDPNDFWSINGVRQLPPASQTVARELFIFRDKEASSRNKPPFKIFGNRTLFETAQQMPVSINELHDIHGMTSRQIHRYGHDFIRIVRENQRVTAPPARNHAPKRNDIVHGRYETLHKWRKKRAAKRGVESDVIVSRQILWDLASANPQTPSELADVRSLGAVRRKMYGQEILQILRE